MKTKELYSITQACSILQITGHYKNHLYKKYVTKKLDEPTWRQIIQQEGIEILV